MAVSTFFFALGFALILIGFVIVTFSVMLSIMKGVRKGDRARVGGLIMIGPFPIVFGSDKETVKTIILLSIVLLILGIVLIILLRQYAI
ncbi:MAG: DUF131 domain-containing protein [Nitrososphaerota archaeon]|nr:DUF131 domain-containing protein [Candidatus Bathyarchaeota archaeon]MDW8049373.1 DUF131 domain-containing protein [Nitrososphaerota archaeon]